MMKRVLVTGATGFIGRHAITPLLARGYDIHVLSSRPDGVSTGAKGVNAHCVDLMDTAQTSRLLAEVRPSHLLHFAWYAEPGKFWHSGENFRWLEASIALLRNFEACGGRRAVMAGTCAEYDWDYGYCSEFVTPCHPRTSYGVCKNAMQETLRAFCAGGKVSGAWGRIFFVYGPYEHPKRLVSSVITSLLRGETARVSHGRQIRDILHVEDVGAAFGALLDSPVEGPVNIASGSPVTLKELILFAADCLGARDRVQFGAVPVPLDEPRMLVGDNRRLSEEVGWNPQRDLRNGMEQAVDWWKVTLEQATGLP